MTPTSVGMRCPECAGEKTQVRTLGSLERRPVLTQALIAINIAAFLLDLILGGGVTSRGSDRLFTEGALYGPLISSAHEYWRLVTYGFLHSGIIHIGFNMYILWTLGQMLEPTVGSSRFGLLYFTSLLAGALGALIVTPDASTVGASGAVFGLMGGAIVALRSRGFDPLRSDIGAILLLNLLITFVIPGISIGGHIGGLIGGLAASWLLLDYGKRNSRSGTVAVAATVGLAVVVALAAIAVA